MNLKNVETKALVEELMRRERLTNINTYDLVDELISREGVDTIYIDPYEKCVIRAEGPAIVLKVID